MDLLTFMQQWGQRPLRHWVVPGNQIARYLTTTVLVLAIAYEAANLTWLAIPTTSMDKVLPQLTPPPHVTRPPQDLSALIGAHLFGETEATVGLAAEALNRAPDTELDLRLTGVLSREDPMNGVAVIAAAQGEARTYIVGDVIDKRIGASLHAVYADRVILRRGEQLETLRLPRELSSTGTE